MKTLFRAATIILLGILIIILLKKHGFTNIESFRSSIRTRGLIKTIFTILANTWNGFVETMKERRAQADSYNQLLKDTRNNTSPWLKALYFLAGLLGLIGLLPLLYLLMLEKHERDIALDYWKAGFVTFIIILLFGTIITLVWLFTKTS